MIRAIGRGTFAARTIVAPDGTEWNIGVRWLPRPPRWVGWRRRKTNRNSRSEKDRSSVLDSLDVPGCGDGFDELLIVVVVILALLLVWFLVIPAAIFIVELLVLLVIAGFGIAAKVLFRRPWIIQADNGAVEHRWPMVGTRASRRAAATVADALAAGQRPEDVDQLLGRPRIA